MSFRHLAKRRPLLTLLFLVLAVAQLAPSAGAAGLARAAALTVASSQQSAPSSTSGNSGTIKISESPDYQPPAGQSNEPHVTCPFWVQGYGFPVGGGWLSVSVQAPAVPPQTVGQVIIDNLPYTDTQQADGSFFNVPGNAVGFGAADGFVSGGHYEVDVTDARNDKNKVFFTASCAAPTATPTATPTDTPTPTATPTDTPTDTPTNTTTSTPTNTPTNTPTSTPTNTPTAAPTEIRYVTLPAPSPVTVVQFVPASTSTPAPTYTPAPTTTPAPTYTPAPTTTPFSVVAAAHIVTKTRYRTVTKTRYRTVVKAQYRQITRTTTRVKTRYVLKTVMRYRTVTRVKHLTRVRTIVHHKLVYQTRVRYVTVVRYRTRVVIRHRTVVRVVAAYHYLQHPKTGRFAAPAARWQGGPPPVEARISIARLGIRRAPVWARGFIANSDGSFRYDLVPYYGVTRFSLSARFGQPGLSLLSGHDDIDGSIFRYLGTMRRGDVIRVWEGKHTYRYVVRSVQIVAPDDVRALNAPRVRPTLALISCTPYWVDTHRVVVIAQMS